MREMQALVRNYVLNRDRQMKYLAVLIALSLFVSFMVPFILMQPADSMAEASACGIEEHVHTEEAGCYQLFCAPEEGEEHVHSERCYALICEKIVHTHTPNCYPTKPDFSALFSTIYDPENLKATADGKSYANSPKDKPSEYKAPAGSILGVATHFHIFAESVSLQSHVHGNIATNWLLQNGAFGVYNDRLNGMSSINYIRNLGPNGNLDNAYQTQLIMGSDYSSPPSPWFSNRYEIRSKKDRKTYYIPKDKFPMWFAPEYVEPQVKFEKKDRPFINITQELNKFAEMSMDLVEEAQKQNLNSAVTVTENGENLILDFSNVNDKYIYYTIDATDFGMTSPWSSWMKVLQIKGITEDKFLFLNIDVGTNPDAYFSKSWMVYKDDGTTFATGEVPLEDGGCRVLYNIVSSDGNGGNYKPFEGKAVFGERRNGSILAPNADVNVAGNTNGTIIARNFVATGESHRCDIQQEGTEGDDADWSLGEETPTTPKQQKLEITVKKNWSGGTSYNGVKVVLYKSKSPTLTDPHKVPGKEATLSSDNGWQTVFKDLPAYEAEEKLYYFVKEETEVSGFTATYENNMISVNSGTITITNVAKKKINVSVEKKWEHPSGSSTTDINVKLYQTTNANLDATKPEQFSGMTAIGDVWLNSGKNWKHTFSDLPELSDDGQKYYYYIVEQNVPANYAAGYTGNGVNTNSGTVTVTNSKDKMVSVTAKKEWKPTAPGSVVTVKVNLYQSTNGSLDATKASDFSSLTPLKTATLTAYNNWTYQFPEYPAMDASGNKYYYYIVEQDAPSGYTTIYTNNGITSDSGEVLITNVKDITVTAKKIWDPDTVASTPTTQETKTYKIMPIGDSITQGETGGGAANGGYRKYLDYIFDVKYEEYFGKDKTYDIDLVGPKSNVAPFAHADVNEAVETTFTYNGTSVTFTYDNNHAGYSAHHSCLDTDINNSVLHKLQGSDNAKNPGSIKEAQPDIVLLMIGTNDRNSIVSASDYEQRMRKLLDYMLSQMSNDGVIFLASIPAFYLTWKPTELVNVTEYNNIVKKLAQEYQQANKNVRFVDVNSWITLSHLNDGVHPGEAGYEIMGKEWAKVIDSYIKELQPVTSSVPAETREPINVRLYKSTNPYLDAEKQTDVDQMTYVQDATLNSDNGWTGKFEGLPAMENGSTLYYYIVEKDVPKHYTVTYSNNAVNNNDGTVVVTNTKEKMLNITLDKEWVGGKPNNENITVTLYQSTERNLDMTVSDSDFQQLLNSNKLWEYKDEKNTGKSSVTFTAGETPHFTNLPVYNENGTMYYYYVRESDVSGYKPSYSKNPVYGADKEVTITNTKMISINVTKNWSINTGTVSSKQITVELYKYKHVPAEGEMSYWPSTFIPVGAELVETKTINANGGKVTFDNLPIEENGYKLFYYVKEADDAEITKNFDVIYGPEESGQLADPNQPDTYDKTITNKEKAETEISITVNKDWDVEDFFYDFDKDGTMDPPNEYYVQDSVNPVEQWADPIKVTLQYSTDGTNWTDYERYKDVEFYTTYTFTNLPKTTGANNTGSPYYYRVVESYNYGYVTEYKYPDGKSNINASEIQKGQAMPEVELKNTLLKRTLNVKKNWYNNINDGVDKVVVEIYRRTTNKKPDLGINPDGTISGGGGNTGGDTNTVILQGMFENGSNDGWTLTGSHSSDELTSGVVSSTNWDASNDSGPGAYMVYIHGLIEYTNQDVLSKLTSGNTYSISAQATRPYYSKIVVNYSDGTSETFTFTDKSQNTAWTDISAEFTVPSGKTVSSLQIGINHDGGLWGTPLCIDDVKVELKSSGGNQPDSSYINSFDNNTTEGWTQVGNHKNDTTQSGLQSSPTYDGSAYSYGLISQNGTANGAVSDLSGYYYCSYIQKEFTDLTAGSTYNFSTKVTRTTGDPVYVALRAVYNDGTPVEIARVQTTANKIDWKELAGDFTVSAGTTNVKLQIVPITNSGYMGTMMYVDDVKVELVSTGSGSTEQPTEAPTQAPTNPPSEDVSVVKSWSFENQYYLDGWESHNGGNPTYTKKDGIPVPDGSSWVEITVTSADMGMKATDWNNVVAGSKYLISAQVSRGDYSTTGVQIKVNDANSGTTLATITGNAPNGGWNAVSGYFVPTSGGIQIFVTAPNAPGDTLAIDAITITGPYPSSNSKPRNVETFFSGSNTLTKRQLNVQMLDSNKLAKNINDYKTIDVTIPKSNYSVNDDGGYNIAPFTLATTSDLEFMRGAKLSHLEVHFRQGGDHFNFPGDAPTNTNIYLAGPSFWQWNYKMNPDKTIHTFEANADYTFTDTSVLMSQTPINPENIERVILKCTDGSTLVINNVKTERTQVSDTTNTKDITLSDSSYTGVWFNSSESSELNNLWAGQKIAGIDVYFDADAAVESGDLSNDISVVKNAISGGSAHGASINKFGFYLMLNRNASDGAWGGEFTAESVAVGTEWVSSSNTNMKVAKYTINTGDTWQGHDDYSDGTNKSQLQSGKYSSIIFLTKMSEDIKAIVVRTESGQKYELTNTVYPATVKQDPLTTSTEKWYPILNSYETGEENQNTNRDATYDILLTPEEMKEHLGKTVQNVQVSVRGNAARATCQTYIKHSDGTGGNLLGTTSWNENGTVKTYEGNGIVVQDNTRLVFRAMSDDANDTNPTSKFEKVVVNFTDGTSYTVWNMNYVPFEEYHKGHETSFVTNGTTNLLNNPSTYEGYYDGREIDYITVSYGEDGDQFVSVPRDMISLDGTQGTPAIDGGVSMKHTYSGVKNVDVLKVIEDASDDFTLAEIKEIKIHYNDGFGSTYTITNTDYSPKAPADTPAIGNQPALGSDFVFISTLDLTKDNNWQAALDGLPVTDGQGNAYEYVIVEKNVYGEGADRYQLVSYEHPDGVILEKDGTQTSFLNTTTDDENGLVIMPSSGGEGKTWFYVAGVALMLCGIAGCYGMKRRQRSRR